MKYLMLWFLFYRLMSLVVDSPLVRYCVLYLLVLIVVELVGLGVVMWMTLRIVVECVLEEGGICLYVVLRGDFVHLVVHSLL
jgi:hypothetical protein